MSPHCYLNKVRAGSSTPGCDICKFVLIRPTCAAYGDCTAMSEGATPAPSRTSDVHHDRISLPSLTSEDDDDTGEFPSSSPLDLLKMFRDRSLAAISLSDTSEQPVSNMPALVLVSSSNSGALSLALMPRRASG